MNQRKMSKPRMRTRKKRKRRKTSRWPSTAFKNISRKMSELIVFVAFPLQQNGHGCGLAIPMSSPPRFPNVT